MEASRGIYIYLAERSSLAKDYSLRVGGGVVDQGFRGDIQVILQNLGNQPFDV